MAPRRGEAQPRLVVDRRRISEIAALDPDPVEVHPAAAGFMTFPSHEHLRGGGSALAPDHRRHQRAQEAGIDVDVVVQEDQHLGIERPVAHLGPWLQPA